MFQNFKMEMCSSPNGACPYNGRFGVFQVDVHEIPEIQKIMWWKSYILLIITIINIVFKNLLLYGQALGMAASFPNEFVSMRLRMST